MKIKSRLIVLGFRFCKKLDKSFINLLTWAPTFSVIVLCHNSLRVDAHADIVYICF